MVIFYMSMKRILVPIHPKSDLENILQYAEAMALRSHASLTLLLLGGWGRQSLELGSDLQGYVAQLPNRLRAVFETIACRLNEKDIRFEAKPVRGIFLSGLLREIQAQSYDLLIVGRSSAPGIRSFLRSQLISRLIGLSRTPVFVIPPKSRFSEIRHITFAVDLTDYDPAIIRQIKAIAGLFDAKLTVAHVNSSPGEGERERYLLSLERTISDTLDYPKVNYKFFDHADAFGGISHFVSLHNSEMLAMTNRRKFSLREWFSPRSLTRKMARELSVPLIAFHK